MKINVLFVSHSLTMSGGANRSMLQLILELKKNHDINPIVLVPYGKTRENDEGLNNACIKNHIKTIRSFIPWLKHEKQWTHRFKYLCHLLLYPILIKEIKKYNIHLVHSNGSIIDLGLRISNTLKVPHIWHLREFGWEDTRLKPIFSNSFIQKKYNHPNNTFIAISRCIKDEYSQYIHKQKIELIYNGIDSNKYKKISVHNNNLTQFAIVGVVTEHKNQLEAIHACNILIKRNIKNFQLTIIGPFDDHYKETITNYINENNLNEYINVLGTRNDVPDILSKMDVGLMLSKSEAFGRVTIEYMFQNLLVIASNTGANPELITDSDTGLIYQFGKAKELANKMEFCIKNPDKLKEISKRGREFALNTFPSEKNSENIFNLYSSLLYRQSR